MMRTLRLLVPAVVLAVSGCSSHYLVRDPANGNTYYTTDVDRSGDAGAVKFKDDASGAKVTILQSEVLRISDDEYKAGIARGR